MLHLHAGQKCGGLPDFSAIRRCGVEYSGIKKLIRLQNQPPLRQAAAVGTASAPLSDALGSSAPAACKWRQ